MKIILTEKQYKFLVNLIRENDDTSKENVMFVGDSHSAVNGWTWNYLLEKSHPNWNVTHVVEGGKRTDWMLNNMLPKLEQKKYDKVFIYGGTNDVMSPIKNEVPISNIQRMVDEVNKQGGQAYVVLGFDQEGIFDPTKVTPTKYCDKKCFADYKPKRVDYQKRLAESIKNAIIIPKLDADTSWTKDGIHAMASKHKILKDHVENYIKNVNTEKTNDKDDRKEKINNFFQNYANFLKKNEEVKSDSSENKIRMMQIILSFVMRDSPIDYNGKLDEITKENIIKFQKEVKIPETGYFDLTTQDKLTNKLFPTYTTNRKSNLDSGKTTESKKESKTIDGGTFIIDINNPESNEFTVIWGGQPSASYGAKYMKKNGSKYFSDRNVIYSNWENSLETLKSMLSKNGINDYKIKSVSGFSAGGVQAWKHINDNLDFVGLIDPTTKKEYSSLPSNVEVICNSANWSYPTIAKNLRSLESKNFENVKKINIGHFEMPVKFYEMYSDRM